MDYCLLIGFICMLVIGYIVSVTNRFPSLCLTLRIRFLCSKDGALDKLFVKKASREYPHSIFRIIELLTALIISPLVVAIYMLIWIGRFEFVIDIINSPFQIIIGVILIALSLIYPIALICINEVFKAIEKKMQPSDYQNLEKAVNDYYDNLNSSNQ